MKNKTLTYVILSAITIVVLYFAYNTFIVGQCAICNSSWTNIGRSTQVYSGGEIDIWSKVQSYNSLIKQSGKTLYNIDYWNGCKLSVYKVATYTQSGKTYYEVWTSSKDAQVMTSTDPTIQYICPNKGKVGIKVSPSTCESSSNPDYENYQVCKGIAGADIYIPSGAIINMECIDGETKTKSCEDGSAITIWNCVNNKKVLTGDVCLDIPEGSETIPPDDSETTTPTCQDTVEYCADGTNVVTAVCVEDDLVATGYSCSSISSQPDTGDAGMANSIVLLVVIVAITATGYVIYKNKVKK